VLDRRPGCHAVPRTERHGGERAQAARRALEMQWLARELAVHRSHAVGGEGRELEYDHGALEW